MIKEKRMLYAEDLRQFCIRNNYYTCGTCKEYEHLFSLLRGKDGNYKHLTTKGIERIAMDIINHSSDYALKLKEYGYDRMIDGMEILIGIMFDISEICTSCFHEE